MAITRDSQLQYSGRVGETQVRKINGKYYIGKVSGPTAEQVKTLDAFKNTRKNNAEFKGASKFIDNIYNSASGILRRYGMQYLRAHLMKMAVSIKKEDTTSAWGERGFGVTNFLTSVKKVAITNDVPSVILGGNPIITRTGNNTIAFNFEDIEAIRMMFPEGATHFRLVALAGAVSAVAYDSELKEYASQNLEAEFNSTLGVSDYFEVATTDGLPTLTETISIDDLENFALMGIWGIQFYKEIGTKKYELKENACLMFV